MSTFGERVRKARMAVGLTQEQLGFACGLSKQSVSDWEKGRQYPNFQAWPFLRASLQRSLDELICGDHDAAASVRAGLNLLEGRPVDYVIEDAGTAHAKDSRELSLLLRYRALGSQKQNALLDLLKP